MPEVGETVALKRHPHECSDGCNVALNTAAFSQLGFASSSDSSGGGVRAACAGDRSRVVVAYGLGLRGAEMWLRGYIAPTTRELTVQVLRSRAAPFRGIWGGRGGGGGLNPNPQPKPQTLKP